MDRNFARHFVLASLFFSGLAVAPAWGQFAGAPTSLAPLVRSVAPAVVGIAVTEAAGVAKTPRSAGIIAEAAGSGFIIRRDGMIVTNDHVIAGAQNITVTLNDGERYAARLVGADDLTDIAVIKITSSRKLTPARWGNSDKCLVGDWVLAAGNPFALGNSFTLGIISAEGRDIGDGPFEHFLQLDAPINPGNSGGPAFNMAGEVIGINSAIVSPSGGSVGIGFAIPSNSARRIVSALIANGSVARGWLGVAVADAPGDADDAAGGAEITGVEVGSPAAQAGLEVTDIVRSVDGKPVAGASGLTKAIASMTPGAKVVLGVSKNQHISYLPVIVDRRPVQFGE
ncbi:MAG: endopeptidase [Acidocella sp. 20-63-7]|nr:MAG: endopeptidase [Acidocella sp. 20-63-7]HQT45754.1 trypsin-like peptidase domain-containing protein [Acidocella sp.]